MPINEKRTANMRKKSPKELNAIADSCSLSAAAAEYEIARRLMK